MKNYIQAGKVITVSAPTGGVASGDALVVGNIFGIAAYGSAAGDPVEIGPPGLTCSPEKSSNLG